MSNTLDKIINTVTANGMREITVDRAKQIAVEYAEACSKASLEKVSNIVYMEYNGSYECKQAILSESNIVIL